jgi:hypothetical protein
MLLATRYKYISMSHMFHSLSYTVISILALRTGDPIYLISVRPPCYRSSDDAYSSMVHVPGLTYSFVGGLCCPTLDFVGFFLVFLGVGGVL